MALPMSTPRLYAESFAPWCEKARWALDHHRVRYRYTEHVPMLGEMRLRIAARRARGIVTVPLLVHGDEVLMDSVAIARHAEQLGEGTPLFPAGRDDEITVWNERSEAVMTAGRAMLLLRLADSTDALREQLPAFVPRAVRPMLQPLASSGVSYLARKYGIRSEDAPAHESRARAALDTLRSTLADGRKRLIGDAFSFADITTATALQFILPVADPYMPLGPSTREAWTHQALATEYADLLTWRDELYADARHP
jgi:glutathione S-transferase